MRPNQPEPSTRKRRYGSAKCAAVPVSEKIYRAAFPGCRPAPLRGQAALLYVGIIGPVRSGSTGSPVQTGTRLTSVYGHVRIAIVFIERIFVPVVPDHGLCLTSRTVGIHNTRQMRILDRAVLDASRTASRNTARIELGPDSYTATNRSTTAPRIAQRCIEYPAIYNRRRRTIVTACIFRIIF